MLERLMGLETEYAVRLTGPAGAARRTAGTGNHQIYRRVADAIALRVETARAAGFIAAKEGFFTANGGGFNYEHLPQAIDGGLIEGSTPECRGPSQLLLYQQAQDRLLEAAVNDANRLDPDAVIGLLKNCRDADGHIYGAQENYEAELASGLPLLVYRIGLAALVPAACVWAALAWLTIPVVLIAVVAFLIVRDLARTLRSASGDRWGSWAAGVLDDERTTLGALGRVSMWLDVILSWPIVTPYLWLLRLTAFRSTRRLLPTFLASRAILTGTGTLDDDGAFHLSEKAAAIRRVLRSTVLPGDRPMFDTGNLVKDLLCPVRLAFVPLARLFRRRQRLQLGASDSNMAQPAELLKTGATCLVLDMIEAGVLDDAPRLRNPIAALHTISADATLTARVLIRGGEPMTALELQRFYLDRARRWLHEAPAASIEAHDIVRLWGEALDALERDPRELFGRLDWPTKRALLDALPSDASAATRKKLDLRYHELGDGYYAQLEAAGQTVRLVPQGEAEAAWRRPPADSPAILRGRLVRNLARSPVKLRVSWDSAGVGGRLVLLDEYRRRRTPPAGPDAP